MAFCSVLASLKLDTIISQSSNPETQIFSDFPGCQEWWLGMVSQGSRANRGMETKLVPRTFVQNVHFPNHKRLIGRFVSREMFQELLCITIKNKSFERLILIYLGILGPRMHVFSLGSFQLSKKRKHGSGVLKIPNKSV